ncbi:MAG: DNA helicase II [Sodalis sp. (in: enterobacteria)]
MVFLNLLNNLNDKQREAVTAPRINLLVLAGAGSGKTRVLVHRIAWLLSIEHCSPYSVMAVTFTNKAAAEIRQRIEYLVGAKQSDMWIGTFHGLAFRVLRAHYQEANLPQNFQILDSEDQLRLLKRLIRGMYLDEKQWSPRQAMRYIEDKKNNSLRPQQVNSYGNSIEATWQNIYLAYQNACDHAGLVDFNELLLRTYELWINKPDILRHYRERFSNIFVDEFQDTNKIQYAWIHILAGKSGNVMIVGDDDQSIYGWRGAQVKNIQNFLSDFSGVQIIRLEQNYRSTSNILQAANALIGHNGGRLGKHLWTAGVKGDPITIYCAFNELDEARFVVNYIKMRQMEGVALKNFAVLYRNNAQSRVLEETFFQTALPCRIYGGIRFFERKEIKDALAYLRLIANRNDDAAYERVINTPPRGLGDRTLALLRQIAYDRKMTLWQSSQVLLTDCLLTGQTSAALQRFLKLLDRLSEETALLPLDVQTVQVIKKSGLLRMYEQEKNQTCIENLEELIIATRQFSYTDKDQNLFPLQEFLSHTTLNSSEAQTSVHQDSVQLMTLHSSKGLEFSQVFIVGMEEGVFPTKRSIDEIGGLEEERRLAYVGVTRAMEKLILSYAETRRLYGKAASHCQPSRFLGEFPSSCVQEVRLRARVTSLVDSHCSAISLSKNNFNLGQRVCHPKFGEGMVINLEGSDEYSRLQIAFEGNGIKWLMAAYARLKIL